MAQVQPQAQQPTTAAVVVAVTTVAAGQQPAVASANAQQQPQQSSAAAQPVTSAAGQQSQQQQSSARPTSVSSQAPQDPLFSNLANTVQLGASSAATTSASPSSSQSVSKIYHLTSFGSSFPVPTAAEHEEGHGRGYIFFQNNKSGDNMLLFVICLAGLVVIMVAVLRLSRWLERDKNAVDNMIRDDMRWAERGEKQDEDDYDEAEQANPHAAAAPRGGTHQPLLHGTSRLNPNSTPASRQPSRSPSAAARPHHATRSRPGSSVSSHHAFTDTGTYDHYPILPSGGTRNASALYARHSYVDNSPIPRYPESNYSHKTVATANGQYIGNYYPWRGGVSSRGHGDDSRSVSPCPSVSPSPSMHSASPSRAQSSLPLVPNSPSLSPNPGNTPHRPSSLRHTRSINSLRQSRISRDLEAQYTSPSPMPGAPPLLVPAAQQQKFPTHLELKPPGWNGWSRSASNASDVSGHSPSSSSGSGLHDGGRSKSRNAHRASVGKNGLLSPPVAVSPRASKHLVPPAQMRRVTSRGSSVGSSGSRPASPLGRSVEEE